jgi:hypothetical protein
LHATLGAHDLSPKQPKREPKSVIIQKPQALAGFPCILTIFYQFFFIMRVRRTGHVRQGDARCCLINATQSFEELCNTDGSAFAAGFYHGPSQTCDL